MTAPEVGSIGAQSAVRRWQMDDVTFTYVVDGSMSMVRSEFLPAIPSRYWDTHPDELDADGRVAMSTGGLLVERDGHRLLIDAGFGPVQADSPLGRIDCGALLDTLGDVGIGTDDIDMLALTHLHVDHTGWMFTDTGHGEFAPTFANARYVIGKAEWAPFARGEEPDEMPDHDSVIDPLRRHPQCGLLTDGDEIAPGVTAVVTPGHSVGHTSYVVSSSSGRRLIAFGDIFHVPAQLSHPEWGSAPDAQPHAVPAARKTIVNELSRPETYSFALHFGDQSFGRVVTGADGTPHWCAATTEFVSPPPRPGADNE